MRLSQEQAELAMAYREQGVKLRPTEVRLLFALRSRRIASHGMIVDALWADDPDGGPLCAEEVIRTYICNLRKKGFRIRTIYGQGYLLLLDPYDQRLERTSHEVHSAASAQAAKTSAGPVDDRLDGRDAA